MAAVLNNFFYCCNAAYSSWLVVHGAFPAAKSFPTLKILILFQYEAFSENSNLDNQYTRGYLPGYLRLFIF